MRAILVLAVCLAAVAAAPRNPQKIVGGSVTSIDQYPSIAALLYSLNLIIYTQACGSTILNTRSVVTAAHCLTGDGANRWRVRVGSTWANSGGVVHGLTSIIIHPRYNSTTYDSDIAIMHTSTPITYSNNAVQPGFIVGANYNLADNQVVWAVGWGNTEQFGAVSERLRTVQIWSINQAVCKQRYDTIRLNVTSNMLCAGWLDVGGRDQCQGDSGGPLYNNNILVGITSWGFGCGDAYYPGVNARVSSFTTWIQANV